MSICSIIGHMWLWPWQEHRRCACCGRFKSMAVGRHSITTANDLIHWSVTQAPTAAGDLGMDVSSGRPSAWIGGAARPLMHLYESEVFINGSEAVDDERLRITDGTVIFHGSTGGSPIPDDTAGTFFGWIPEKGAFRAGIVDDSGLWNSANIGPASVVVGKNNSIKQSYSVAGGENNKIDVQSSSVCFGIDNTVGQFGTVVFGENIYTTSGACLLFGFDYMDPTYTTSDVWCGNSGWAHTGGKIGKWSIFGAENTMYGVTADSTPGYLYASYDTYPITLARNRSIAIDGLVLAWDVTNGKAKAWQVRAAYKIVDFSWSYIAKSATVIQEDGGTSSWDCELDSDPAYAGLTCKITGADSTDIHWVMALSMPWIGYNWWTGTDG